MSDLAIARVRRNEICGAVEAIRPVLDLSPDQRIHGITSSVRRVHDAVVGSGATSVDAIELQDELEDFQATSLPAIGDR